MVCIVRKTSCVSAKLYLKLERFDDAVKIYRDLHERNPENWAYYTGLEEAMRPGELLEFRNL